MRGTEAKEPGGKNQVEPGEKNGPPSHPPSLPDGPDTLKLHTSLFFWFFFVPIGSFSDVNGFVRSDDASVQGTDFFH